MQLQTSNPKRPRSTSTPTWRSNSGHSTAPHHQQTKPGRYQPSDSVLAFLDAL